MIRHPRPPKLHYSNSFSTPSPHHFPQPIINRNFREERVVVGDGGGADGGVLFGGGCGFCIFASTCSLVAHQFSRLIGYDAGMN